MSLVTCPECGKKNVSDTAEACPECGYAVKMYYQKIREEEAKREQARKEEERRREEEQEKQKEEAQKQQEIIIKLEKQLEGGMKEIIFFAAITFFLGGLTVWCLTFSYWNIPSMLFTLVFGTILYSSVSKRFQIKTDIELTKISLDSYQRAVNKRKEISKAMMERDQKKWKAQHPKCPNCGSFNTKRITATNRAISTVTFGIASSVIGKQYRCNKCKHLW